MALLSGKRAVILGLANDYSIAWGIAQALHREGATLAFNFAGQPLERRVRGLAEALGSPYVAECNVTDDAQIAAFFAGAAEALGAIDIVVHSVAFAPKEELRRPMHEVSREGYLFAVSVSAYSLIAVAREALPYMAPGGSLLAITYYGGEKVVPGYGAMGPVKSDLERIVQYLAYSLGPHGIRANAISSGPIKTLASRALSRFQLLLDYAKRAAPLRRNVSIEDVGDFAACLVSDLSRAVTGEIVHVDCGLNVMGVPDLRVADDEGGDEAKGHKGDSGAG